VEAGATDVTAIDIVRCKIDAARLAARPRGGEHLPEFVHADIHGWQPGRRFDVVVSVYAVLKRSVNAAGRPALNPCQTAGRR